MEQPGRIFMIDNGGKTDGRYQSLLEEHGYEVFATNNAYQLIRYAEELHPQLYVVDKNAEDVDAWQVLNYLSSNRYLDEAPAVMLNAESTQEMVKGASHYVSAKENGQMLVDIADAYCRGGRGYKVLLLEDYLPYSANEFNAMEEFRISYFKVYDAQRAAGGDYPLSEGRVQQDPGTGRLREYFLCGKSGQYGKISFFS